MPNLATVIVSDKSLQHIYYSIIGLALLRKNYLTVDMQAYHNQNIKLHDSDDLNSRLPLIERCFFKLTR
jgi:hypothetical protein